MVGQGGGPRPHSLRSKLGPASVRTRELAQDLMLTPVFGRLPSECMPPDPSKDSVLRRVKKLAGE